MWKLDQEFERQKFVHENRVAIDVAQQALLFATRRFLDGSARAVMSGTEIQTAVGLLKRNHPTRIAGLIRPLASEFGRAGMSGPYWDLIDSLNSYDDAIGTRWEYLTQDQRKQHLVWVLEDAPKVH